MSQVGDELDVIMLPKVDGAWDMHYLDQLLAQLEARHSINKPVLIHAILETAGSRTKQVRVPLNSLSDVDAFCEMVRVKWEFEQGRLGL